MACGWLQQAAVLVVLLLLSQTDALQDGVYTVWLQQAANNTMNGQQPGGHMQAVQLQLVRSQARWQPFVLGYAYFEWQGMASYVQRDLGQGTATARDYDLYCHYVAARLVGEGLSRLFVCTGYEQQKVADVASTLANTMGLFL
jgi:phytoene/squalene synthetase